MSVDLESVRALDLGHRLSSVELWPLQRRYFENQGVLYLNAKEFLPHIPQDEFPAQALTVALYREYGIRGVEIGTVMFGKKDPKTRKTIHPELEMVRLAIPRRVYTNMQITYVAESLIELYRSRDTVQGLKMTYEAPVLRHFTARFEELASSVGTSA